MTDSATVTSEPSPAPRGPGDRPAPPAVQWLVRNETPRPIWIEHAGRILSLAPHEECLWAAERTPRGWAQPSDVREAFPQLGTLVDRHQVALCRVAPTAAIDVLVSGAARVVLILGFCWLAAWWPLPLWWWLRLGAVLAIGCALWFLVVLTRPARRVRRRTAVQTRHTGRQVGRWTWYNFTMVVVLAVGILVPAA